MPAVPPPSPPPRPLPQLFLLGFREYCESEDPPLPGACGLVGSGSGDDEWAASPPYLIPEFDQLGLESLVKQDWSSPSAPPMLMELCVPLDACEFKVLLMCVTDAADPHLRFDNLYATSLLVVFPQNCYFVRVVLVQVLGKRILALLLSYNGRMSTAWDVLFLQQSRVVRKIHDIVCLPAELADSNEETAPCKGLAFRKRLADISNVFRGLTTRVRATTLLRPTLPVRWSIRHPNQASIHMRSTGRNAPTFASQHGASDPLL